MITRLNFTKQDIKLYAQYNWIKEARAFYAENLMLKEQSHKFKQGKYMELKWQNP